LKIWENLKFYSQQIEVEEINKNLPNSLIPNIQTGAIKETSKITE
jgi:hypothetical protein